MDYTKENLIKEAIKRLETLEDTLQEALESINAAYAERRVIRYLLFLGCEKKAEQN